MKRNESEKVCAIKYFILWISILIVSPASLSRRILETKDMTSSLFTTASSMFSIFDKVCSENFPESVLLIFWSLKLRAVSACFLAVGSLFIRLHILVQYLFIIIDMIFLLVFMIFYSEWKLLKVWNCFIFWKFHYLSILMSYNCLNYYTTLLMFSLYYMWLTGHK